MLTIKDATKIFGQIDDVANENLPALDKALRNLSQRHYLPPAERRGRADLYSLATICALRLIHIASGMLSDRWILDGLARAMQNQPTGPARRVKVDGGERPMGLVEEAVARVREGQTFNLNIAYFRGGRLAFGADWTAGDFERSAIAEAVFAHSGEATADLVLTLPASRLIAEVLAATDSMT